MTAIDNSWVIAPLIDEEDDGDTFWYTELLDRSVKGPSRVKLLRSFEHSCRAHFLERVPVIRELCDRTMTRAYTRLSPRSRKQVGHHFCTKVVEQTLAGNYHQLRRSYASSCGVTAIHDRKLWLFDVDGDDGAKLGRDMRLQLTDLGVFVLAVPTKNGCHLIAKPHHVNYTHGGIALHKDNPTVMYMPDGAP